MLALAGGKLQLALSPNPLVNVHSFQLILDSARRWGVRAMFGTSVFLVHECFGATLVVQDVPASSVVSHHFCDVVGHVRVTCDLAVGAFLVLRTSNRFGFELFCRV